MSFLGTEVLTVDSLSSFARDTYKMQPTIPASTVTIGRTNWGEVNNLAGPKRLRFLRVQKWEERHAE